MIKQSIYILLIACISYSCKSTSAKEVEEIIEEVKQELIEGSINEQLSTISEDALIDWKEFQDVATDIERYTSITKSQALENANALSLLVKNIADTIRVEELKRPDIKIRLNVLYNHSLRLDDMLTINSISEKEVAEEVNGLLAAYSSINNKINSIYTIAEIEKYYGDEQRKFTDSLKEVSSKDKVLPKKELDREKSLRKKPLPNKLFKKK